VAQPGQPITYTLAFSNTGSEIAAAVVLTDLLPPALTDLSYTSSLPVTPTGGTNYTWQLPDLAPGTSGLITVTARLSPTLTTEATITNSATIATTAIEITTNNTASVALAVSLPRVRFSASNYSVDEAAGSATITLTLDAPNPFADVSLLL